MVRRIRLGMVGGGPDGFIGAVHRMAIRMSEEFALVATCLSSDSETSHSAGRELGIDAERAYGTYLDMVTSEESRSDCIEAVLIVTPNHLHHRIAKAFMAAGIHVICDKPLTATTHEAEDLATQISGRGPLLFMTMTYSGYPLVRYARALIKRGVVGNIRLIQVQYLQGWLSEPVELKSKGAAWRLDPALAGPGGCVADIGIHAFHLAEFVTGLKVRQVAAECTAFIPTRSVPDDAQLLLRLDGGVKGNVWMTQVAIGEANDVTFRVYGDEGSIQWSHESPEELYCSRLGSTTMIRRGERDVVEVVGPASRLPPGHPEGYLEAFANIYHDIAEAIRGLNKPHSPSPASLAAVHDGLDGMYFIDAVLKSASDNSQWTSVARAGTKTNDTWGTGLP